MSLSDITVDTQQAISIFWNRYIYIVSSISNMKSNNFHKKKFNFNNEGNHTNYILPNSMW